MFEDIGTIEDLGNIEGKRIIVRVDFNCPLTSEGEISDDRRIRLHAKTIEKLIKNNAKIVLMTHQGRPAIGEEESEDFITTEKHAKILSEILSERLNREVNVEYVEDIFGKYAIEKIKNLKNGEVILLENVRIYAEENTNRNPDVQANTLLVKKLYPLFDYFINDGFSVSHRSQPSVVGFTRRLPSVGGDLLIEELIALKTIRENPRRPLTFILAGAKAEDTFKILEDRIEKIDYVLTGGIIAHIFLKACGYNLGEPTMNYIKGKGLEKFISKAKEILEKSKDKIILPDDVAIEEKGERKEISIKELPKNFPIYDIGEKTIEKYRKIINESGSIFAHATMGKIENSKFRKGTEEIIKAFANSSAYKVIGGGHTIKAARELNVEDKIDHVCSGGGAALKYIAGESLPGVEALRGGLKVRKI
ncbi:MAG: phosphoglycerate kinase [Candidatus Altarchaeaceae archaeon]